MAAELDDEDGYPIVEGVFVTPESESDNNNKDDDDLEGMDLASLSRDLDHFHENEAVQVALAHNVDLTAYSRTTDAELQELEDDVIAQHFAEADKVAGLAVDMDKCGAMLEKMQDMLQLFQKNLSQVSAEMRRLQNGCEDLDTKLKNRRRVERRLRKFIEHIVVSPAMKHTIETQPVKDATFAKALAVLNEKISFIRAGMDVALLGATERVRGSTPSVNGKKGSEKGRDDVSLRSARLSWLGGVRPADTVSVQQIIPDLEDLRRTAVGRIQEFFVSIFTDIRQAEGEQGAQMMLQNSLQKHTELLSFLRSHAPTMVKVLQESYTKTIERLFGNTFKTYLQGLLKAGQQADGKNDLIVVDENARKGLFSTKVDMSRMSNSFVLGPRIKVLDDLSGFMPVTVEEAAAESLRVEWTFRSFLKRLKETAILETEFLVRFFGDAHTNEMFQTMFARVFNDCRRVVADFVERNFDMVGLLLVVMLIARYSEGRGAAERYLRPFFASILSLVNTRFDAVVQASLENLKNANPRRMGAVDLHPHVASRRFAEMVVCVHTLKGLIVEAYGQQHSDLEIQLEFIPHSLISCLSELTMRFVELVKRLASQHSKVRSKTVFLINNLDQVLQSLKKEHVEFPEIRTLRALHAQSCSQFVMEQLSVHFQHLHTFIQQLREDAGLPSAEGRAVDLMSSVEAADCAALSRKNAGSIERVVTSFAATWKQALRDTDKEIVQLFSNYRQGTDVLKRILEEVLTSYTVFSKATERHCAKVG
eukprot:INCI16002.5.p2 GENE.INCI16002.5~~INCI16002.5.p2  ORF type:complete len:783 (-),score=175.60 INCI16002.5:3339-5624(-)